MIAYFYSIRGNDDGMYARKLIRDLSLGIVDVSQAAGLPVTVQGPVRDSGWQLPGQFEEIFGGLEFPTALASRIEPRREMIRTELASIRERKKTDQTPGRRLPLVGNVFSVLGRKSSPETSSVTLTPPDPVFQLRIETREIASRTPSLGELSLGHAISVTSSHSRRR